MERRPLKTRQTRWAGAMAGWLAAKRVMPNVISVLSIVCAAVAAAALWSIGHVDANLARAGCLFAAAAGIQLRLLCNMMDGMVAVEGGFKTATGDIYNDLPDRISDTLILLGAGYGITSCSWGPVLGWAAALGAIFTAYVRLLAGSTGGTQRFLGPMAKPHRMATLTVACLAGIGETYYGYADRLVSLALVVIILGTIVTSWRRTTALARELNHGG